MLAIHMQQTLPQQTAVQYREPGNLVFIRGTQGIAAPIKRLTKSPYTHVAGFVMHDQLIESQGFRKTGYEDVKTYEGVADIYACELLTDEQRFAIIRYATQEIGTSYDYFLIGLLGIRLLLRRGDMRYSSRGRRICTTLWADAYRAAGIDLCPGIAYPTPGDLARSPLLRLVGSF